MWIRSQDKRLLINLSNVYFGGMEDNVEIYQIGEQFNYTLGFYSSLEKAMRVMDMIQKQIAFCSESYEIVRPVLKSDNFEPYWKKREVVFNMPEDTEI